MSKKNSTSELHLELYYFECQCQYWVSTNEKNVKHSGVTGNLNYSLENGSIDYSATEDGYLNYDLSRFSSNP